VEVLAINGRLQDCLALRSILGHTNWVIDWATDLKQAKALLERHPVPVVLCPKELPGGTWSDVLAAVSRLPNPPKVLVYASQPTDDLWNEFLNAGGYDLLPLPFDQDEVLRTISLACRQWNEEARRQPALAATA
jgi:DNA-binding NtrC family response regulator